MAYTTIKKPSDYFNTKLYTGNGGTNAITGVGFQPDFTWIKNRSRVEDHVLYDAVRGATKRIQSNLTDAETTKSNGLTAFGTDGFTVGSAGQSNYNGDNIASWNWKANGTGSANTDGDISSTVSVNTTSGFSIVSYSGNSTPGATVGHSLGTAPSTIIVKVLNESTYNWNVYHKSLGATKNLKLNLANAEQVSLSRWNDTEPTSSVFSLGNAGEVNETGKNYIAYCFAEKQGFSKFGSYTGNGSTDGTFVYTGFKPSWVMIKNADNSFEEWGIWDSKRDVSNIVTRRLVANIAGAENTSDYLDFTSNGFKIRTSANGLNQSGSNLIYMAFAEEPLVGDNPATAR